MGTWLWVTKLLQIFMIKVTLQIFIQAVCSTMLFIKGMCFSVSTLMLSSYALIQYSKHIGHTQIVRIFETGFFLYHIHFKR